MGTACGLTQPFYFNVALSVDSSGEIGMLGSPTPTTLTYMF